MHGLNLIHADIKPDNIMLCNYTLSELDCNRRISFSSSTKAGGLGKRRALRNTEIRLIDFGTATFLDESYSAPVGTMAYCAPEALLGLQASFARDIWSIGCVLVELLTGRVLFEVSGLPDPRPNHMPDYLAMIEKISGSQIDDQVTRIVDVKSKAILSNFTSYAMQVSREKVNAVEISLDVSNHRPELTWLKLMRNRNSLLGMTISSSTSRIC
jgi:serine/threonine protein kinase